jgi:hypothetical protein
MVSCTSLGTVFAEKNVKKVENTGRADNDIFMKDRLECLGGNRCGCGGSRRPCSSDDFARIIYPIELYRERGRNKGRRKGVLHSFLYSNQFSGVGYPNVYTEHLAGIDFAENGGNGFSRPIPRHEIVSSFAASSVRFLNISCDPKNSRCEGTGRASKAGIDEGDERV